MGALSSSREPSPCSTGLGPSGFDPERFEDIAQGCAQIGARIADYAISGSVCEDVERLEHFHDNLANEVANLAAMLRAMALAIAMESRQDQHP